MAAGLSIAAIGGAGPELARAQSSQSPSARETAVARSAFKSGMQAARSGDWETARKDFERAYDLVGRPLVLLNLAGAQAKTGRLVEGAESYREFLQLSKEGRAAKLQGAAKKQLEQLEARIPHVTVRAPGLQPGDRLAMDGEKLSRAVVGAPLPVNPGAHTIVVERGDEQIVEHEIEIEENQEKDVGLDIPEPQPTQSDLGAAQPTKPSDEDKADAMLKAGAEEGGAQAAKKEDTERRLIRSPWLWGGIGAAVAVGAATLTAVMLTRAGEGSFQDGDFKDGGGHIWVGP